jgi:hypothetical protein
VGGAQNFWGIAPSGDAAVSSLDQQSTWSSIVEVAVDFPVITGDHLRQPEIDDPQHLLQLIMDNKIEVVAKILQMESRSSFSLTTSSLVSKRCD